MTNQMYDQQAPAGYGYGRPSYGMPRRGPIETKPFFLTSEFLFTVLGIVGVAITAAVASDIDSRLSTELIAGLIAAYTVSRGIAKAGSSSRAPDPREDLLHRAADGRQQETAAKR